MINARGPGRLSLNLCWLSAALLWEDISTKNKTHTYLSPGSSQGQKAEIIILWSFHRRDFPSILCMNGLFPFQVRFLSLHNLKKWKVVFLPWHAPYPNIEN